MAVDTQSIVVRTERGLVVAGTRITLYQLLDYLKGGWLPQDIQQLHSLAEQQMDDVLAYIEAHRDEVEAEYQQVLQYSEESRQYWEERNRERLAQIATMPPKPGQEALREKLRQRKAKLGME